MSDPFEKAKKIRKGELDHELPDFEEITGWFGRVPMTWLPALLNELVQQCAAQGVFQDGKLLVFVEAAEKAGKNPSSILRKGAKS